jgi:CDP-diacylglycerol--serine O-phosphatidyltransferase
MAAPHRLALLDLGVADLLTLGNGVMGMLAIVTLTVDVPALAWLDAVAPDPVLAAILIGIGAVLDGLDGVVAARLGGSELGSDLDSLSDLITFVLAPAILTLVTFSVVHPIASIVVALTILIFGTVRLARFNASPEHEARDFTGLPSPVFAAGTVLLAVVWTKVGAPAALAGLELAAIACFAFAMISTVPYPKARRRARSFAAGLMVFGLGVVAALVLLPQQAEPVLVGALAVTLLIIAFGPITWIRLRRGRGKPDPLAPPDAPEEPEASESAESPRTLSNPGRAERGRAP